MSSRARLGLKSFVWLVGLAPLVALGYWFWTGDLTANPIEFVTRTLGDWALRLLLASRPELAHLPARFDVVALDGQDHVEWIRGAFEAPG